MGNEDGVAEYEVVRRHGGDVCRSMLMRMPGRKIAAGYDGGVLSGEKVTGDREW
jgi:hypothetical protein